MKLLIRFGANKKFIHKNDYFDSNEFICNSKYIRDVNSTLWHQKYSLPPTNFLGFVACRVTSKILWIDYVERSWGDVKKSNQEKDHLLVVAFMISIVLFIYILTLKKRSLEGIYHTQIVKNRVHTVALGMTRIVPSTINYINGVLRSCFIIQIN